MTNTQDVERLIAETEAVAIGLAMIPKQRKVAKLLADLIAALRAMQAERDAFRDRLATTSGEYLVTHRRAEAAEAKLAKADALAKSSAEACKHPTEELAEARAKLAEAVKMLDERDREYNRLTNDMIERHAATVATLTAQVEAMRGAVGSVAEQATFEEWQAEMGRDPKDQGDVSMDWHAGYDAAIRHARKIVAALTTENPNG